MSNQGSHEQTAELSTVLTPAILGGAIYLIVFEFLRNKWPHFYSPKVKGIVHPVSAEKWPDAPRRVSYQSDFPSFLPFFPVPRPFSRDSSPIMEGFPSVDPWGLEGVGRGGHREVGHRRRHLSSVSKNVNQHASLTKTPMKRGKRKTQKNQKNLSLLSQPAFLTGAGQSC